MKSLAFRPLNRADVLSPNSENFALPEAMLAGVTLTVKLTVPAVVSPVMSITS